MEHDPDILDEDDAPDESGFRPTDAEFEERIRIVERLVVLGQAQTWQQTSAGLSKTGRKGLKKSTIARYLQLARDRLRKADEATTQARQEMVMREQQRALLEMREKLKGVVPTYSEYLEMMKLARDWNSSGDSPGLAPVTATDQRGREKADELLVEMLKSLGKSPSEAPTPTETATEKA